MNEEMNISNAQYIAVDGSDVGIKFTVDGQNLSVPTGATGNRHYDEIQRQVEAGTLTIADAD